MLSTCSRTRIGENGRVQLDWTVHQIPSVRSHEEDNDLGRQMKQGRLGFVGWMGFGGSVFQWHPGRGDRLRLRSLPDQLVRPLQLQGRGAAGGRRKVRREDEEHLGGILF